MTKRIMGYVIFFSFLYSKNYYPIVSGPVWYRNKKYISYKIALKTRNKIFKQNKSTSECWIEGFDDGKQRGKRLIRWGKVKYN